jgi:hypothetical protein
MKSRFQTIDAGLEALIASSGNLPKGRVPLRGRADDSTIRKMKDDEVMARVSEESHGLTKVSGDFSQSAQSVVASGLRLVRQNVNTARAYLELLDMFRASDGVTKAWGIPTSPVTGPVQYDLEAPMKLLYPVFSPIRNSTPRVPGTGTAANWRAVVSINEGATGVGISEGTRGGAISQRDFAMTAVFRSIGLENYVTFEMDTASQGYQDVKALAVLQTIQALTYSEELLLMGGIGLPSELNNGSFALGAPAAATLATTSPAGTGGTLGNGSTYYLKVVALSMDMTRIVDPTGNTSLATTGGSLLSAAGTATITRQNLDGTTTVYNNGCSKASAASSSGTSSTGGYITASCTSIPNAYAYCWFLATASTGQYQFAGYSNLNSCVLGALTYTNLAWLPTDLVNNDRSANILVFDGIWTQALGSLSAYINPASVPGGNNFFQGNNVSQSGTFPGGYSASLDGAVMTSDGAGGITTFNTMFYTLWTKWKFGPQRFYVSADVGQAIKNLVVANGGAPLVRMIEGYEGGETNRIVGGFQIPKLINPFFAFQSSVDIIVHPYLPPGNALGWTETLPYAMNNVGNLAQVRARRDYYAFQWPIRTRRYENGVYSEQLAEVYFPPAFPAIKNIATSPATTAEPVITMGTQTNVQ